MTNLTPSDLVSNLQWRYATKSFSSRQIPAEHWDALQEALRLTPTSYGLQPYKFVVVDDPAVRAQLRPHSWNQAQVTDASRFVVFLASNSFSAADVDHLIAATATTRGTTPEALAGYRGMMVKHLIESIDDQARYVWAIKQTYIALGNVMTAAAALGIDACPIEGLDAVKYDEILKVEATGPRWCWPWATGTRTTSTPPFRRSATAARSCSRSAELTPQMRKAPPPRLRRRGFPFERIPSVQPKRFFSSSCTAA